VNEAIERAAAAVGSAEALVVAAGAGMGVDSGLPDFRGDEGFWKAYPPFARLGLRFAELANPRWFRTDPGLAWGFYGHRLELYRTTVPHAGFGILREWCARMPRGHFVFTSNVDGQFQRAGFAPERVAEVHGSIHWMQCLGRCGVGLREADPRPVAVDMDTMRAAGPLPACTGCGGLLRPNILMFGDGGWDSTRTDLQESDLEAWLRGLGRARLVVVECGAGRAIPTVRQFSEELVHGGATLVRINPREAQGPRGTIVMPCGALEGLRLIDAQLGRSP
jgi:NAD-dependent SIR2 family protein deacetylase